MRWHGDYGFWWMGLPMILFWVGVVGLVVWGVRSSSHPAGRSADSKRRAVEILEERYARGEIDDDEFRRRRNLLDDSSTRT